MPVYAENIIVHIVNVAYKNDTYVVHLLTIEAVWPQRSLLKGTVRIGTICQILVSILEFWPLY